MKKLAITATGLIVLAALSACSTSSPDVIKRHDTQSMSQVLDASVLSVRNVTVEGSQSGGGAVAGGVIGGVAGATVGGRVEGKIAGVLGAVAGAVIGNAIEHSGTQEQAVEILLQLRNGERRAVVQAKGADNFKPGDAVILITTGGKTRVTRAPELAASASVPVPAPTAAPAAAASR